MQAYYDLLKEAYEQGTAMPDRTGTGRKKIIGRQLHFKMSDGFPLDTRREMKFDSIIKEQLWFISGSASNEPLNAQGVKIWNNWAVQEEDVSRFVDKYFSKIEPEIRNAYKNSILAGTKNLLGNIYGPNWRNAPSRTISTFFPAVKREEIASDHLAIIDEHFETNKQMLMQEFHSRMPKEDTESLSDAEKEELARVSFMMSQYYSSIDQLNNVIISLKNNPFSSRHVISAWVPEYIPFEHLSPQENVILGKGALAPCHVLQQYHVLPPETPEGKPRLILQLFQRSLDIGPGGGFNVAQYSLMLHMVARMVDMEPYEFIWDIGDAHVYMNQMEVIEQHLALPDYPLPKLVFKTDNTNIFNYKPEDIAVEGYQHGPRLVYPISV